MYLITGKRDECTGCAACMNICPKNCIQMVEDEEAGYIYPQIDKLKCINCHLCEKVCPIDNTDFINPSDIQSFAGIGNSEQVFNSSSGGAFSIIAEKAIERGFIIYGVKFDDNLNVIHDRATTLVDCDYFKKSKYIQSNTNSCFKRIEEDLKKGNSVLFSGVPCQCAALSNYLKVKRLSSNNLLVVSLLCSGVPSQKLFNTYKKEHEFKIGKKIISYQFKNKIPVDDIVNSRSALIKYDDGTDKIVTLKDDAYLKMYYHRLGYRSSCYACRYAKVDRVSDVTLADAWHLEEIKPNYNPLSGVSLILVNTKAGKKIVDLIREDMNLESLPNDWVINSQGLFRHPSVEPKENPQFISYFRKDGFDKAVEKATTPSIVIRLKILFKVLAPNLHRKLKAILSKHAL